MTPEQVLRTQESAAHQRKSLPRGASADDAWHPESDHDSSEAPK